MRQAAGAQLLVCVTLAPVLRAHLRQLACCVLGRFASVGQGVCGNERFLAKVEQAHANNRQHRASTLSHDISASRAEHAGECSSCLSQLTLITQHGFKQRFTLGLLALQVGRLGALASLNGLLVERSNRVVACVDVGCDALGDASSALQQTNASVGNSTTKTTLNLISRRGARVLRTAWLLSLFLGVVPARQACGLLGVELGIEWLGVKHATGVNLTLGCWLIFCGRDERSKVLACGQVKAFCFYWAGTQSVIQRKPF